MRVELSLDRKSGMYIVATVDAEGYHRCIWLDVSGVKELRNMIDNIR